MPWFKPCMYIIDGLNIALRKTHLQATGLEIPGDMDWDSHGVLTVLRALYTTISTNL